MRAEVCQRHSVKQNESTEEAKCSMRFCELYLSKSELGKTDSLRELHVKNKLGETRARR